MGIFSLILSVLALLVSVFLLKASMQKVYATGLEKFKTIFFQAMLFCAGLVMCSFSVDAICDKYQLLHYAPDPEYLYATVTIDDTVTEDTSILYVFRDDVHYQMTTDDVKTQFGSAYTTSESSSYYAMTYSTSAYTLNGIASDKIIVFFDGYDRIEFVKWCREGQDEALYHQLLAYLTEILGEPQAQEYAGEGEWIARWPGFYLECNSYRVAFARQFRS